MSTSLTHDPIRELPIYLDGFHAGRDVGLMVALNVIVAEQTNQDDAARHQYCAGRLLAVGRIVAEQFRQVTHE
jgi:hypothetical protein